MALAISWIGGGVLSATASTSATFSLTSIPTSGGVVIEITNNHPNVAAISAASLSTDGAAQSISTTAQGSTFLFFPSVTTASQTLTVTKDGVYTELYANIWGVTGHDTSDMFGNEASAVSDSVSITMVASGNGLIITYPPFAGGPSGGGTWSTERDVTGYGSQRARSSDSNTGGTISGFSAGSGLHVVEIKASGGGGGGSSWRNAFAVIANQSIG